MNILEHWNQGRKCFRLLARVFLPRLCVRPTGFWVFSKLYPPFLPQQANKDLQLLLFLCIYKKPATQEPNVTIAKSNWSNGQSANYSLAQQLILQSRWGEGPSLLRGCVKSLHLQQSNRIVDHFITDALTWLQLIHAMLRYVILIRMSMHIHHSCLRIIIGLHRWCDFLIIATCKDIELCSIEPSMLSSQHQCMPID